MKVGEFMVGIVDKYDAKTSKKIANWLSSDVQGYVASRIFTWDQIELSEKSLVELANLIDQDKISSTSAKAILKDMLETNESPLKIAEKLQLIQVSSSDDLLPVIRKVLSDNPGAVAELKAGEDKVLGFLIGQIMKQSQGKANPEVSKQLIRKELGL
jgi:aspartyl-tRNA(Asn)/glutamyl-tRNA(Gln) amidotransferase subunit B